MAEEICFFFLFSMINSRHLQKMHVEIYVTSVLDLLFCQKKTRSILYNFKTIKKQKLKMRINERKGEILQRIKESKKEVHSPSHKTVHCTLKTT